VPVGGVRPAAAVAGADDGKLRAEDVLLHLRIVIAVDRVEFDAALARSAMLDG
jgi:hypothetical protein